MTEPRELRATLQRLHAQLEEVESVDEDVREMLRGTIRDIDVALEQKKSGTAEEPPTPEEGPISDRLAEAARHFDESHPVLARTLGGLIDMLGQMGI